MSFSTKFLTALTAVAAAVTLSACASYTADSKTPISLTTNDYRVLSDLRYVPDDWPESLTADVYLPDIAGLRPAVLLVHGGGWERRSRADMEGIAKRLAKHGFVAINISYRFAPQYQFPAQLHDLQQAMRWIHQHAGEFAIDSDRIAGLGYSAGAHLVSLMALVAGGRGELDRPYGGPETRLAAVVAGGTPSDLRKFKGGTLVPQFLGGSQQQLPERYAQASPVTHVHEHAPPFFLYHGGSDLLVPVDHATDFRRALLEHDVVAELYLLRLRGHVSAFLAGGSAINKAMQFLYRELEPSPDGHGAAAAMEMSGR